MKKYLVSGLGASEGGVGRLMRNLVRQAGVDGFITLARRTPQPIKRMLSEKKYLEAALEGLLRAIDPARFFLRLQALRGAKLIVVHPQTIGFSNFFKLVERNSVYLYVMDNSFFCIRSYNFHPEMEVECLRCLEGPGHALPACQPFPIEMKKRENIEYLERFAKVSDKIVFLAQNASQAELIRCRFGIKTQIQIVGLDTGELENDFKKNLPVSDGYIQSYNLVFHGAPQLAKGLRYFVELAESLGEFTAFIPSSKTQCERVLQRPISAANITFKECSWETGLKDAVQQCGLVINPSLWSAPIEGALQKSMRFADRIATVESLYGYEKEYEHSTLVIRLPRNVQEASSVIRKLFPMANFPPVKGDILKGTVPKETINIFKVVMSNES